MNISKAQVMILVASFFLTAIDFNFYYWFILELAFLGFLIVDFKKTIEIAFPTGSIIILSYFLSNAFGISIIQLIDAKNVKVGDLYYLAVPIADYLPFAFISAQLFLIGYQVINKPQSQWIGFMTNIQNNISIQDINIIIGIGFASSLLSFLNISALNQVAHVFSNFTTCGFFALALHKKTIVNRNFIIGLFLQILIVVKSGMFTSFIVFIVYFALMLLLLYRSKGFKINWLSFILLMVTSLIFLAYLQNTKNKYRKDVWQGNEDADFETFFEAIGEGSGNKNISNADFYLPIAYRLNQSWLVSATMEKVPKSLPYELGGTLVSSLIDALVPRFLNPEKERAGGKDKIKYYTNLNIKLGTSMNIGILGEAYINFGKFGAPILLLFYGILIGLLEKNLLLFSLKKPIILLLFPVFFELVLVSETDFLMIFNGILKNTIIILTFIYLLDQTKRTSPIQTA